MSDTVPSDITGLIRKAPLSRRGFMTTSAASAAGYTLAAGPVLADTIHTSEDGLDTGMAEAVVSDGKLPVYFAKPKDGQKPPVILVAMEIFGLHEYIRDVTRRLAKLGALAVAPDLYVRSGKDLPRITDFKELMPIVNAKPDAELLGDLDAAVAWAKSQGGDTDRLAILGFCRGGRAVWEYAAARPSLKAGVAFYGSLVDPEPQKTIWPKSPLELAPSIKVPVLGLYGEIDQGIPLAQVEAMKTALAAAGSHFEIVVYPGVGHGFHADYRPSYNKQAAEDSWSRATAWLTKYGVLS